MLVTSQLPIQTTKFAIISFQRALVPPHFEKGSTTHGATPSEISLDLVIFRPIQRFLDWPSDPVIFQCNLVIFAKYVFEEDRFFLLSSPF